MTIFTNDLQIGKKQDLSDIVKEVAPQDTPFTNSLGSRKVTNSLFNWTDSIATTAAKSMISEGADVTAGTTDYRNSRVGYTEIFAEAVDVSDTVAATAQSGDAPLAQRVADKVKLIARQKETVYLSANVADATVASRNTAGAFAQLSAVSINDNGGTPRALTKALVDDTLEIAYGFGAMIDTIYVNHAQKKLLSTVLTYAAVTREAGQAKVVTDAVDIYQSDFGDVNIVKDRFIDATKMLFADSSMWREAVLVPMNIKTLATTGLSQKRLVNCETGLQHDSFRASAALTDLS